MTAPIAIFISEHAGITRVREPVTIGLPFPRGLVREPSQLSLLNPAGQPGALQGAVLNRWPDGSMKWGLFDFQVDLEAHATRQYAILVAGAENGAVHHRGIKVEEIPDGFLIDTGAAQFALENSRFNPGFDACIAGASAVDAPGSRCLLQDASGHEYQPYVRALSIETLGSLRTTFQINGVFSDGEKRFCDFFAWLSFFAGSATTRLKLTIRNPRRAWHPQNLWDLGDPGSVYIRDFSLHVSLAAQGAPRSIWSTAPGAPFLESQNHGLEIYQDSSGGRNWDSHNHMNRDNKVTTSFCGYRVQSGDVRSEGKRAQPLVAVYSGNQGVAGTVRDFWQNFPKAIEVHGRSLVIRLFPHQYADVHELQGGEQKTHVLYLSFLAGADDLRAVSWVQAPLVAYANPEWYAASGAIPYLTPKSTDPTKDYLCLVDAAIEGDDSFEQKREIIDEYGWRHFGDIYADHEAIHYDEPPPVISHYNNQYDAINGAFIQFVRSGDVRWFHMMDQLASHVVDIDVYHTTDDKVAYSRGLFWHTNHYASAFTATHRSYSRLAGPNGGGPSNEHCYTTGLMHHYFLTGDVASRQTVLDFAQWVMDIDDGTKTLLRWLDRGYTGDASMTTSRSYHGPGRGGGNAINALLDAFILSGERRFIDKAEALIRRCIHPRDDIEARCLTNSESRWSYTVFLQTLGRYLDLKVEIDELDAMYAYAQESLLHDARWMAEHEAPYLSRPELLEFPTETWSAQDVRKSDVFKFAAKHACGVERQQFLERSEFFFRSSVGELTAAKTRTLARPVVLMMSCGWMHSYFQSHPETIAPPAQQGLDFGTPQRFVSQRDRIMTKLKVLGAVGVTVGLLAYWL